MCMDKGYDYPEVHEFSWMNRFSNIGMMTSQLGKKMGAKVIAVSSWIKDFEADYSITTLLY